MCIAEYCLPNTHGITQGLTWAEYFTEATAVFLLCKPHHAQKVDRPSFHGLTVSLPEMELASSGTPDFPHRPISWHQPRAETYSVAKRREGLFKTGKRYQNKSFLFSKI